MEVALTEPALELITQRECQEGEVLELPAKGVGILKRRGVANDPAKSE